MLTISAVAFRCPYPDCGQNFNVLSSMRRHFRNHNLSASNGNSEDANRSTSPLRLERRAGYLPSASTHTSVGSPIMVPRPDRPIHLPSLYDTWNEEGISSYSVRRAESSTASISPRFSGNSDAASVPASTTDSLSLYHPVTLPLISPNIHRPLGNYPQVDCYHPPQGGHNVPDQFDNENGLVMNNGNSGHTGHGVLDNAGEDASLDGKPTKPTKCQAFAN